MSNIPRIDLKDGVSISDGFIDGYEVSLSVQPFNDPDAAVWIHKSGIDGVDAELPSHLQNKDLLNNFYDSGLYMRPRNEGLGHVLWILLAGIQLKQGDVLKTTDLKVTVPRLDGEAPGVFDEFVVHLDKGTREYSLYPRNEEYDLYKWIVVVRPSGNTISHLPRPYYK